MPTGSAYSGSESRSDAPSSDSAPWSPSLCRRTATVRSSTSRSPTTSMYGILRSSASRILRPIDSVRSSTSTRKSASSRAHLDCAYVDVAVGDRQHDRLDRRQPDRELAGVVLDEHADEALEGAHQRAVDHHRAVLGVVGARVGEVEALGHHVVELDGAELPRAADRVGHVQVDLRPVEGAVALVDLVLEPAVVERLLQRAPRRGPTCPRCRSASRGGSRAPAAARSRSGRRSRTRTRGSG